MKIRALTIGLIAVWTLVSSTAARSTLPDSEFCKSEPLQDNDAIMACDWMLDVDAPFHDCVSSFDEEKIKEFYSTCVTLFCQKGKPGVCEFSFNFGDICKEKFDIEVKGRLDFCSAPSTTPEAFCQGEPGHEAKARELCSFVLDTDSAYHDCIQVIPLSKVKEFYKMCLSIYCERGEIGVCQFGDNLADVCKENFEVTIEKRPEFCAPTTPPPFCTEEPSKDENAIEACQFILDVESAYYDCMDSFSHEKVKQFIQICVTVYCNKGQDGVCEFANNLAEICYQKFELTVFGRPSFCEYIPPTDFCTTIPGKDENAIEHCSWILDTDSSFYECISGFDTDKTKTIYRACLESFCENGEKGVCQYTENVAGLCDARFDLTISQRPDFCEASQGSCSDNPLTDPSALIACGWMIDTKSMFSPCASMYDITDNSPYYTDCLKAFCDGGEQSVCDYVSNLSLTNCVGLVDFSDFLQC